LIVRIYNNKNAFYIKDSGTWIKVTNIGYTTDRKAVINQDEINELEYAASEGRKVSDNLVIEMEEKD
jgi:hypothetical protein